MVIMSIFVTGLEIIMCDCTNLISAKKNNTMRWNVERTATLRYIY